MADDLGAASYFAPGSGVMKPPKKLCDGAKLFVAPHHGSAVRRHITFDEGQDLAPLFVEAEVTGSRFESRFLEVAEQSFYKRRVRSTWASHSLAHSNDATRDPAPRQRTFEFVIHGAPA